MIKLTSQTFYLGAKSFQLISERMSGETCKTNISPQLMFRQSYSGYTSRTFVGNRTKTGFWISRFRVQFLQFRPDIIARFRFEDRMAGGILSIRYSIGFSSIFFAILWILIIPAPLAGFGRIFYLIGEGLMIVLYVILARRELKKIREKIHEKLLINIPVELK